MENKIEKNNEEIEKIENSQKDFESLQENEEKKKFYLFKKVGIVDRYNFYEYLGVLLDGGVNIGEAILTAGEKIQNSFFREKIRNELYTYVSSGDTLSKSMKKLPFIFENSEVAIIEAGETTGMINIALSRLSDELKKNYVLRQKVKSALTYPIIIFLFLLVALIIVLTYVIPAITPLFDNSGVELPFSTKALISTSYFVSHNFILLLLGVFALFVFFIGYKGTEKGKANIDYFLLSIPLIGKVYRNYILAGIASNFGNLISSGVPVIKALSLVGKTSNNMVYETIFNSIIERVSKGEKITDAMKEVDKTTGFFPGDFIQMLSVGEKTATLDKVSQKIYNQYSREVEYSLGNLTKWIEPIAILFAGAFVLWFAFAIFGAILKVTQTVG
ncbi:type II secretion system F family protein [Candidatus Gracilibacteria bacterium]|nr:type II secretion system F family protein [Candidatus Gracilibacteria bacterium]NUJ98490.1 type II secretion system F family protein [Candidatus Gracilibacteria bacterium]